MLLMLARLSSCESGVYHHRHYSSVMSICRIVVHISLMFVFVGLALVVMPAALLSLSCSLKKPLLPPPAAMAVVAFWYYLP